MIRNRSRRALALAALAAAVQACSGAEAAPPRASQVVDRYMEAIGGRAAAERFPASHVTAEMSVPAMGTSMTMEVWSSKPNRMRSRSVSGAMTITTGYDGTTAWAIANDQPRILPSAAFEQALGNTNLDASVDFAKTFPTMETIGERTLDGHACWNVRMVSAKGVEVQNCFDKKSGLLVATVVPGRSTPAGSAATEVV